MILKNSIEFKKFAKSNLPEEGQLSSLGSISQYENLYKIVQDLPKNAKILDWGCGNGHFSAYLKFRGFNPISFSFDTPVFIDKKNHVLGSTKEPVKIPFQDESFDLIFSIGVLEHVHESGGSQEASLAELHRILKPGGKFYAYHFPNRFSWIEALANTLQKFGLHSHYTHTKKFDFKETRKLFEDWNLIQLKHYGMFPRNIWGRLPRKISNCKLLIKSYDLIDRSLAKIFFPITQNLFIEAQKR